MMKMIDRQTAFTITLIFGGVLCNAMLAAQLRIEDQNKLHKAMGFLVVVTVVFTAVMLQISDI